MPKYKINHSPTAGSPAVSSPPGKSLALLLAGCLFPLASMAQMDPEGPDAQTGTEGRGTLDEIVVTAARREERLQDMASSITAIGGDTLEERGLTDFEDITEAAAGVYLEMPRFSGSAALRMRGVGSPGLAGIDPSVGVLVDGVFQIRQGFTFTEMMDIERVEVMRGPQGTLFGRNTTAGAIHIHTRDPDTREFSGHVQGVVGNLGAAELRGVVNIPLIQDTLAVRLSGNTVQRDGYMRDVHRGKDTHNQDRRGGRIKVLWNATDDLDVQWRSETQKSKGRIGTSLVSYGRDNITNGLNEQDHGVDSGDPWEDFADELGKTLPRIGLGRHAENIGGFEDSFDRHVLTVNWSLPGHNLESISAYEEFDGNMDDDRDRTLLDISNLFSDSFTRAWSQELILSSEFAGPVSYVLGAFYQNEDLTSITTIVDGEDLVELRGSRQPPIVSTTNRDNQYRAVFANVTFDLTQRLDFVAGARYTSDKKDDFSTLEIPNLPTITPSDATETFDQWTWTAQLKYQFDRDRMGYISYDRGFKSGGFNRQTTGCLLAGSGCLTPDQLILEEETTDAIEVGLNSEWLDGRVRFNAAAFYQVYEDYQVSEALREEGFILNSNAGEVESMGLEFDLLASLTNHLTLDSSVALIQSEYDEFENAPCPTDDHPSCVNGAQDLSGERLDNAPQVTINAGLAYHAPLNFIDGVDWFGRVGAAYKSSANLDVSKADELDQGGYTLFNARLGMESRDRQWKITAWGRNLGDKEYASIGRIDEGGVTRTQGLTRTYGATLDWYF